MKGVDISPLGNRKEADFSEKRPPFLEKTNMRLMSSCLFDVFCSDNEGDDSLF